MRAPWKWHTARTVQHLLDADGLNFALVSMPARSRAPGENYVKAARIIEAAPEMLELLSYLQERLNGHPAPTHQECQLMVYRISGVLALVTLGR